MSYKQVNAAIMLLSAIVVSAWVVFDATAGGVAATVPDAAIKMLWAIGYSIAFNIVAMIIASILFAVVRREELKDERADERDRLVNSKAMRNAYFALSIGVAGVLVWQAAGLDPALGPYALFGISMLAGAIFAGSQLAYYRIG